MGDSRWRLRVVDSEGVPCDTAWACDSVGHRIVPASAVLAEAATGGRLEIDADAERTRRGLVVGAEGFRPRQLDLAGLDPEPEHEVVLDAGEVLSIRVLGADGRARPGVSLRLSMGSLHLADLSDEPDGARPGVPGRLATFSGSSDDEGFVVFSGLAKGKHEVLVADPLLTCMNNVHVVDVPGQAEVVVGEAFGIALDIPDEVIAGGIAAPSAGITIHHTTEMKRRAESHLRERFPGAFIRIQNPPMSVHKAGTGKAYLKVFCRHAGWVFRNVEMRPLSQVALQKIELEKGDDQTAVFQVDVVQEDDKVLPLHTRLRYAGDEPRAQRLYQKMAPGESRSVASGRWHVLTVDGCIADALENNMPFVQITPGERRRYQLRVPGRYRMGRLQPQGPGEKGLMSVTVSIEVVGRGKVQLLPAWYFRQRDLPLPIGKRIKLTLDAPGYGYVEREFVVEDGPLILPIPLTWD